MQINTFQTTEAFFDALLGPGPADTHVIAWRHAQTLSAHAAGADAFAQMFEADATARREARAQEVAAQYTFNPTTIRAAYDRWNTGGFSKQVAAPVQRRIHLRALDIALARAPSQKPQNSRESNRDRTTSASVDFLFVDRVRQHA